MKFFESLAIVSDNGISLVDASTGSLHHKINSKTLIGPACTVGNTLFPSGLLHESKNRFTHTSLPGRPHPSSFNNTSESFNNSRDSFNKSKVSSRVYQSTISSAPEKLTVLSSSGTLIVGGCENGRVYVWDVRYLLA